MQDDNRNQNNDYSNNGYGYNGGQQRPYGEDQQSSYYAPPQNSYGYYGGSSSPNGNGEPPKKKGVSTAVIVIGIVAATVIIVFVLAMLSMLFTRSQYNTSDGEDVDMGGETLTIVQNAPSIDLTQNTDVDYVPQSIPEVVKKIGDSVVEISTSSVVTDRFFHQYVTSGAGSGVIITQSNEAGYLLTNHHVIDEATEIVVRLTNGEEYKAKLLGSDAAADLAVLRIEKKRGETFTAAPIGDSSKLTVGQQVIAIGNPLGSLGGTVTDGIISALDRTVTIDNVSMVLLQHNAAINPGNSGGGLFDAMGNLIGIVNAKTSETGIEGLGFAIPINIAYEFFNRVIIVDSAMGIRVTYGSLNQVTGLYVTEVSNGSSFKIHDRITAVNGKAISSTDDYYKAIGTPKSGDEIVVSVKRNYSTLDIKVVIK